MARETLNDKAWKEIFNRYDVLDKIYQNGFYEISSEDIREYREPRLMAKFDHKNNLPKIMDDNSLSILPISTSRYIIGDFSLFQDIHYDDTLVPEQMSLPAHLDTIKSTDLYSEASALHCAYLSGMISDFMGEEVSQTVSGRMGSKSFNYDVMSSLGTTRNIGVNSAQIEIDGGYEGIDAFMLTEAKKQKVDNFNIRQLYYPYRTWLNRTDKHIRNVFFTISNDVFHFFEYEFTDTNIYNSLVLVKQKDYMINHQIISQQDVNNAVHSVTDFVREPEIPFPQADDFTKVIDLLGILYEEDLTKDDIAEQLDFDVRQSDYYYNSCLYLGLANKYKKDDGKVYATLNNEGIKIMQLPYRQKRLELARKILEHKVFKDVYIKLTENEGRIDNHFIVDRMRENNLYNVNKDSTYYRRASTIRGWTKWIYNLPNK